MSADVTTYSGKTVLITGGVQVLVQIWRVLLPAGALMFGLQVGALAYSKMLLLLTHPS